MSDRDRWLAQLQCDECQLCTIASRFSANWRGNSGVLGEKPLAQLLLNIRPDRRESRTSSAPWFPPMVHERSGCLQYINADEVMIGEGKMYQAEKVTGTSGSVTFFCW